MGLETACNHTHCSCRLITDWFIVRFLESRTALGPIKASLNRPIRCPTSTPSVMAPRNASITALTTASNNVLHAVAEYASILAVPSISVQTAHRSLDAAIDRCVRFLGYHSFIFLTLIFFLGRILPFQGVSPQSCLQVHQGSRVSSPRLRWSRRQERLSAPRVSYERDSDDAHLLRGATRYLS